MRLLFWTSHDVALRMGHLGYRMARTLFPSPKAAPVCLGRGWLIWRRRFAAGPFDVLKYTGLGLIVN